ncbi:hypothetical protein BACCIP111883_02863 [Sutcliffiella rhizosphaerae]|uniref:Uncharacterized protein n=1 Tax=Sutcliffiella rhizosphaerae TaxID=2880967 RepID=A0ABM8YQ19_9BACI|nr:hypothetical protein BACCIP111883_02863 [Sutcliffiella rhizosphaerae]
MARRHLSNHQRQIVGDEKVLIPVSSVAHIDEKNELSNQSLLLKKAFYFFKTPLTLWMITS